MSLKFDFSDFERAARRLDAYANQVPFALARALNDSVDVARKELIDTTWAQHIKVRNPSFLRAALTTKGTRANKRSLRVELYDRLGRGSLLQHAQGGTKLPRGTNLAIPATGTVRRGSRGVPKTQRPRAIVANTPKRALRITSKGIFVGQGGQLRLRYAFKTSARIKADVPFQADFNRVMRREIARNFGVRIEQAMKTAFRK